MGAKDIMADDGTVLDGTKDSTADDFAKIDGGGEGTEGDDRKIDKDDWVKGFKEVTEHGFVAFQGIKDKKAALKVFSDIDDNGGGIILLDEWCAYIKKKEVEAGTVLGKSLMEEQSLDDKKGAAAAEEPAT